jgi:hypothetical protein
VTPARNRSQLEIASIVVALVFGAVLLTDSIRLYASYDSFGADVAVPLFAAIPALAGAAWALFARHGRRIGLAVGMLLPLAYLVVMSSSALIFVASPLSVLLLLAFDRVRLLQPVG